MLTVYFIYSVNYIKNLTLEYLIPVTKVFSVRALTGLAKGIARAKSLSTLSLTNSDFGTAQLKQMFPGFCNNRSLSVLSLANNQLDDSCGTLLGKIISTQGFLKDELVWLTSLRNEVPKTNLNDVGINTLILDGNKAMSSVAIRDMCAFIKFDTWFRSLSLNHLDLTQESLGVIVDCLDKNKSVIMLGLEGNKRLKTKHINLLNKSLARNISEYTAESRKEKTIRKALKKQGGKGISETDFQNFESPNKSLECSVLGIHSAERPVHARTFSELDRMKRPATQLRSRPGTASSASKQPPSRQTLAEPVRSAYKDAGEYQNNTATSIGDVVVHHSHHALQSGYPRSVEHESVDFLPEPKSTVFAGTIRQLKTEGQDKGTRSQQLPGEGAYRVMHSSGVRDRVVRQNSAYDSIRRPHPDASNL